MTRFTIDARPGSKHASVRKTGPSRYTVAVTQRAERGKATDAVRRALADTLGVAPSRVSLVMGGSSRVKVFEII